MVLQEDFKDKVEISWGLRVKHRITCIISGFYLAKSLVLRMAKLEKSLYPWKHFPCPKQESLEDFTAGVPEQIWALFLVDVLHLYKERCENMVPHKGQLMW